MRSDKPGLRLQKLRWVRQANGCWEKYHLPGQVRRLSVQLVLLALGYTHPDSAGLIQQEGYMTSKTGVFCCGDARRGQSLVVWAIREGRQCARAIDNWLSDDSTLPLV